MTTRPPRQEFLVFGSPLIGDEEIEEVVATMRSGWLGTGPKVKQFEEAFAEYKGIDPACVAAVNSCTAALHVSLIAAGIQAGDEVITTPLTFCATVNAIIHAGATPVLADIDPVTLNLDPTAVRAKISPRTRAIVPVHFAGRPCEMPALMALAELHNLTIIEDCAHAIETEYAGKKAGTFGAFGCFSFYVTKNVVTGEGGMVVTRDLAAAGRVRTLALHGMDRDAWTRFSDSGYKHYYVVECGFKYNMMDLQAAIGLHQLAKIEAHWQRRRVIWERYQTAFANLPAQLPAVTAPNTRHGLHLYTVLLDPTAPLSRDEFLAEMTRHRIGVGVHYLCLAEHPYYQERFGWRPEDYPHATAAGRCTVSLPLGPKLLDADIEDVISCVSLLLAR
ncbi:MAG: DegT/DnrJ/EryC1/StrS family aminotransferase [Gammaproteobacteria bacterium]|nr:DegT/DnrJ/EryC1/StrS family aminotransferase [Gammaproteobacteria bacterium]